MEDVEPEEIASPLIYMHKADKLVSMFEDYLIVASFAPGWK
jgi:hypothetical protein